MILVGRLIGPHGLRGELKVGTDLQPEELAGGSGEVSLGVVKDDRLIPEKRFTVLKARRWKHGLILSLDGIDNRDKAAFWTGWWIMAEIEDLSPLPEGEFFFGQLRGLVVVSTDGQELGVIADLLPTGGHDLYVVADGAKEWYLPAVKAMIRSIDLDRGTVTVDVPQELIDLNED